MRITRITVWCVDLPLAITGAGLGTAQRFSSALGTGALNGADTASGSASPRIRRGRSRFAVVGRAGPGRAGPAWPAEPLAGLSDELGVSASVGQDCLHAVT